MLISLSRAEKLIGSYNLSLLSFLIERMSKGRGKHFYFTHFHFLIPFLKKSFITSIDIFIISTEIFNLLHIISRKKNPLKTADSLMNLQSVLWVCRCEDYIRPST